jgi:hypothetical protein
VQCRTSHEILPIEEFAKTKTLNATMINNLGVCYESGYSVVQDQKKALTLYRRAADLGDDTAMCNLGLAHHAGRGTLTDLSSAAYWYLESAKKNTNHPNGSRRAVQQLTSLVPKNDSKHELKNNIKINRDELPRKSAIEIQRLWRGFQTRNKVALTLPSVLTHWIKLKLWNEQPLFPQEELERKLFAVHASDYFPKNGIIKVVDPKIRGKGSYFRPTTHFSLGELVRPHTDDKCNWEQKKFAVITPLKDLIAQLLSLNFYDTYLLGDFKLTKDSLILVPEQEAKQYKQTYPNLQVISYDLNKENLRQATKKLVIAQNGYDVVTFNNHNNFTLAPAIITGIQLCNQNTPRFFAPILRQRRAAAVGLHVCSLFGSSYLMGIVDEALTQLGFSPDYLGRNYIEDPAFSKLLIEHALDKIENNPDFVNNAGYDVLKLHLGRAREGLQKIVIKNVCRNFVGDCTKARIARLIAWPDLLSLIRTDKRLALQIYNMQAFLCLYSYYRTCAIGEYAATKEGLKTVFSHHLNLLEDCMRIQVIGNILYIRNNYNQKNDMKVFPGGSSYLQELIIRLAKSVGINVNPLDKLDVKADIVYKSLVTQQQLWLFTQIDLPDADGNVPLVQAILARDEEKALNLIKVGANYIGLSDRDLASLADRRGLVQVAALLREDAYAFSQSQIESRKRCVIM